MAKNVKLKSGVKMEDNFFNWKLQGCVISDCPVYETKYINFPSSVELHPNNIWKLWLCTIPVSNKREGFNVGYAILENQILKDVVISKNFSSDKAEENHPLSLVNLPEDWRPLQPIHINLNNGKKRLYFWIHGPDVVRFLAAESNDEINYKVINPYKPCLYHPADRAVETKKTARGLVHIDKQDSRPEYEPVADNSLICNDATNVYMLDDGTFEMFTVELITVDKKDSRYISHDNAAGWFRVIERRVSKDGLSWSPPQRVLEPDKDDPSDLQFYYLSVTHTKDGRIGLLGHYRAEAQTMDIEICFSENGINWKRPFRKPCVPRNLKRDGLYGIYASNSLIDYNNEFWLFYTAVNYTHNYSHCSDLNNLNKSDIRLATIDKNNFKCPL